MKRTGFTLIELLVVIAIIAILAAILFPVFARARAKAQQTTCLSNMKQIALSELMYASDYDELTTLSGGFGATAAAVWPISELPGFTAPGGGGVAWPILLQPYMKNTQLFSDPVQSDTYVDYEFNVSSGMDSNGGGGWCGGTGYQWWNLNNIQSPADKIMFICGTYGGAGGCYAGWPSLINGPGAAGGGITNAYAAAPTSTRVVPHNGGCNVNYFDGHAKFQTIQYLADPAQTNNWMPYS